MNKVRGTLILCLSLAVYQAKGQTFVSHAEYHQETDEISTSIRVKSTVTDGSSIYTILSKKTDSLVYKDQDESYLRERIDATAFNFLDTTGYSHVQFFNEQYQFLGNATFIRFEHQSGYVDASIRAVFKFTSGDRKKRTSADDAWSYIVSRPGVELIDKGFVSNTTVLKTNIPEVLRSSLKLDRSDVIRANQISWGGVNKLYSVTYGDYKRPENVSYIIEVSTPDILLLERSQFAFFALKALPVMFNGLPLLLSLKGKPDTDWTWFEVLYFDGTSYTQTREGRLPIQDH